MSAVSYYSGDGLTEVYHATWGTFEVESDTINNYAGKADGKPGHTVI